MSVHGPTPSPPPLFGAHLVNDSTRNKPSESPTAVEDTPRMSDASDILKGVSPTFSSSAISPTLSSISGPPLHPISLSTHSTPHWSRKKLSPRSTVSNYSSNSLRSRSISNFDGYSTPTKGHRTPRRASCELFLYDGPVERYLKSEGLESVDSVLTEASYDGRDFSDVLARTITPQAHRRLKEFTARAIDHRDSKLSNQREQIQRLSMSLSMLNDDYDKSNEYMRESDGKLATLSQQLSTVRRRLEAAEGRTTVLEERVEWYKTEVKRLEDELEKAHTERRKAFSEKMSLYHDVEQAKRDLTDAQADLRTRSSQLHAAEERVKREVEPLTRKTEELVKQLKEKEVESYDLRETSCTLRIELSRREETIVSLKTENRSLRSAPDQLQPEDLASEIARSPRKLTMGSTKARHAKSSSKMLLCGTGEHERKSSLSDGSSSNDLQIVRVTPSTHRLPTFAELGMLAVAVLVNHGTSLYDRAQYEYERLQQSRLFGCFCKRRKTD